MRFFTLLQTPLIFIGMLICSQVDAKRYNDLIDTPMIGISLGTYSARVGIWMHQIERFEIIPNEYGETATPSYVAFTDDSERLIGQAAKDYASIYPKRAIYEVQRLMGRNF